jgi:hypothetical protein
MVRLVNATPWPLYPEIYPVPICIECWVVYRAGLDGCEAETAHTILVQS